MRIGIFAKTFSRNSIEHVFDAVRACGLDCVQFNWSCAGLPAMPLEIDPTLCDRVRSAAKQRGTSLAAVSGTFNMIHPDPAVRRDGLARLSVLASAAASLGTGVITLCTGTRDPDDMWRRHPDNDTAAAWSDLIGSMQVAVRIAAADGVTLAFEPEVANTVDSARKARRLLDEIGSLHLKVVMDPANLFHAGELPRMREILEEAFALLGRDVAVAHAKDLSRDGEAGHDAAGTGVLDYDLYLALLRRSGFDGPLILHGLREDQVDGCVAFLRRKVSA